MLRLDKVIKPWKEAAALNDHINLYGFWNETAFLTKSGDLGMVLRVSGVDYESLDHARAGICRQAAGGRAEGIRSRLPRLSISLQAEPAGDPIRATTTTPLSKPPSTSGGSSSRPSATGSTKLRSSIASSSKARGRRPALARHLPASSAILPEQWTNSRRSSPAAA